VNTLVALGQLVMSQQQVSGVQDALSIAKHLAGCDQCGLRGSCGDDSEPAGCPRIHCVWETRPKDSE
jgi:hypothetical protein